MTARPRIGWIWACWAALLALLALTTGLAFLPLGRWNLPIALGIGATKALIVVIFFMELRRSSGLVRVFAAAGFLWLLILLGLTGADYATRHEDYVAGIRALHEPPASPASCRRTSARCGVPLPLAHLRLEAAGARILRHLPHSPSASMRWKRISRA